ncbi:MAG: tRNA (adenosine(37)-N6)-threonylcarbamoyltransferase complex dimerization subunit type 1 TsaB [Thermoanaerobaculia bacterium]|nr:tRNA (adenosine(37)-N6)-threonylcarbamoyltransferase complex dimerization subunit type 1 TsaB [Thermoanaerobaculia bacterium]
MSVALLSSGDPVRQATAGPRTSSSALLGMIDGLLADAGLAPPELGAVAALAGPGSFTGLRVGLSTALGLHQALGLPAAALPTLEVLAAAYDGPPADTVVAVVDALRGEWFAQLFAGGPAAELRRPRADPAVVGPQEIAAHAPCRVVGFGAAALADLPGWPVAAEPWQPPPLAATGARLAAAGAGRWDAAALTRPLYLRGSPAQPPGRA